MGRSNPCHGQFLSLPELSPTRNFPCGGGAVQLEIIYPNLFRTNDARADRRDFKRNLPVPPGSLKLYPRPFERNTRRKQLERVRITPFQFASFSDVLPKAVFQ